MRVVPLEVHTYMQRRLVDFTAYCMLRVHHVIINNLELLNRLDDLSSSSNMPITLGIAYGAALLPLFIRAMIKSAVVDPSILIWIFFPQVCIENGCLNEKSTESILRIQSNSTYSWITSVAAYALVESN